MKGYSRSIIYDLQRNDYDFISNELYQFLVNFNNCKITKELFVGIEKLDLYLTFLLDKEYIFFCESKLELEMFSDLSLEWKYPSHINATSVELNLSWQEDDFKNILKNLNEVQCWHLQIYSLSSGKIDEYSRYFASIRTYSFRSVELIIPYYKEVEKEIEVLFSRNLIINNSPCNFFLKNFEKILKK